MNACQIDENARPADLTIENWVALEKALTNN